MRKHIPRMVLIGLMLILALALIIPTAVFAVGSYPSLDGDYYECTGSYQIYNMDGALQATYKGIGLNFTAQSGNLVGGDVILYNVSSTRSTYLTGGTGVITKISLKEGANTVTVTSNGTLSLVLPAGVAGVAVSGNATVTGSPLALAAAGTRSIPVTTPGVFTLTIYRTHSTVGVFAGVVGQNTVSKPRFQFIGTQVYGTATDGTGTVTGSPLKCFAGTTTLDVTANGTIAMAIPYGMYGEAASGTATVTNSPVTLTSGETTTISTGTTTGSVTITLHAIAGYNIAGYMGLDKSGNVTYLRGRIDGFIVTEYVNWGIYQFNEAIKMKASTLLP
jgi:hypothetical protein